MLVHGSRLYGETHERAPRMSAEWTGCRTRATVLDHARSSDDNLMFVRGGGGEQRWSVSWVRSDLGSAPVGF